MNINKKLDRVKQWAGEKMGQEAKTNVSDDFKALELEMALRHEGMEELQKSMTVYIKSLSKRNEAESKLLPVAYLGQTMSHHGEDFEPDSEFGNCLIGLGRANDRLARHQEAYVSNATNIWLESLERSLVMMKEYQAARKKLEQRRLAYDASLSKMQKAKREDFRVEEELRSQKAKYEESSEDVMRRMQDIKEAEADSVRDLGQFLDAELEYYDKCRDELQRLKREWPAKSSPTQQDRRPSRSRSNTAHSYNERFTAPPPEEPISEPEPIRPSIRSQSRAQSRISTMETHSEYPSNNTSPPRKGTPVGRASTFQGPTTLSRVDSASSARKASPSVGQLRANLRPTPSNRISVAQQDTFGDPSDDSTVNSGSPDHYSYRERSVSPATSHGSVASRGNGNGMAASGGLGSRKAPPPPPSRAKKPPPPLPMKRADVSATSLNRY